MTSDMMTHYATHAERFVVRASRGMRREKSSQEGTATAMESSQTNLQGGQTDRRGPTRPSDRPPLLCLKKVPFPPTRHIAVMRRDRKDKGGDDGVATMMFVLVACNSRRCGGGRRSCEHRDRSGRRGGREGAERGSEAGGGGREGVAAAPPQEEGREEAARSKGIRRTIRATHARRPFLFAEDEPTHHPSFLPARHTAHCHRLCCRHACVPAPPISTEEGRALRWGKRVSES